MEVLSLGSPSRMNNSHARTDKEPGSDNRSFGNKRNDHILRIVTFDINLKLYRLRTEIEAKKAKVQTDSLKAIQKFAEELLKTTVQLKKGKES